MVERFGCWAENVIGKRIIDVYDDDFYQYFSFVFARTILNLANGHCFFYEWLECYQMVLIETTYRRLYRNLLIADYMNKIGIFR